MTRTESFNIQNEIGKKGEEIVKNFLLSNGYEVIDVSSDEKYQREDTDFIVVAANGAQTTVEVKTDLNISETQNFLFEDVFHHDWGDVESWFNTCSANYICYYDIVNSKCYWIDVAVMKKVVPDRCDRYSTFYSPGDHCYKGGYIMSVATALSVRNPLQLVVNRNKI